MKKLSMKVTNDRVSLLYEREDADYVVMHSLIGYRATWGNSFEHAFERANLAPGTWVRVWQVER